MVDLIKRKVLLVEDDLNDLNHTAGLLRGVALECVVCDTLAKARDLLQSQHFDILLTDLHLGSEVGEQRPNGLEVIELALILCPNMTIVAYSNDPRAEIWELALSSGAHNFLRKPIAKADELTIAIGNAWQRRVLLQASKSNDNNLSHQPSHWIKFASKYPFGLIIDEPILKRLRGLANRSSVNLVITGETGTGKEECAKLLHRLRSEKEGSIPFVAVNCATITGSLAESLLFGHKKGAFTGADQSTIGYVAEADGGILFLDEIHALDMNTQHKLLRVLNDGSFCRVGETKTSFSRFQLVAASTKDLELEVEAGRFLMDMWSRLMGIGINLLPLRERKQDISAFLALFLAKHNVFLPSNEFDKLGKVLEDLSWKGNVRQLFKSLEAWLLYCEIDEIQPCAENFHNIQDLSKHVIPNSDVKTAELDFNSSVQLDQDLELALEHYEKAIIDAAMRRHGSIAEVCRAMNIPRSTLDSKRKKYGLS